MKLSLYSIKISNLTNILGSNHIQSHEFRQKQMRTKTQSRHEWIKKQQQQNSQETYQNITFFLFDTFAENSRRLVV